MTIEMTTGEARIVWEALWLYETRMNDMQKTLFDAGLGYAANACDNAALVARAMAGRVAAARDAAEGGARG